MDADAFLQGQQATQRAHQRLFIASRQVRAPVSAAKERIAGKQVVPAPQADAAGRMPRRMQHGKRHARQQEVAFLQQQVRLALARRAAEHDRQAQVGMGQHGRIRGMDGHRHVRPPQRRDRADMVDMSVRQHNSGQPSAFQRQPDGLRLCAGVNDQRVRPFRLKDHICVCLHFPHGNATKFHWTPPL